MKKAALAGGAVVVIAAAIAALTYAGPRGVSVPRQDDYPLDTGLTWTYRGAGNVAVVRRIDRSVEINGLRYFEMKFILPVLGARVIPMRHRGWDVVTARDGKEFLLMRIPMAKGDRWTIDLPGEPEIAECTVIGPETIEYAGKTGEATKLEVRRRNRESGKTWTDYEWYASGIGLVKMQATLGIQATFVLERFERAK